MTHKASQTEGSPEPKALPANNPDHQHKPAEETPADKLPDARDQKTYYSEVTPFRRAVLPLILVIFRALTRFAVTGAEQMPLTGPVILAANHLTNYDVFFLQAAIRRPIFFMGKEELFRHPVMDWGLRQMGGFPVYRSAGDEWALRHAERVLTAGQVLGMFPEGTRSKGKGLKPAKTGVARLALAVGCPIVPVALYGTQHMFKGVSRRTLITVTFGGVVYPEPGDSALGLTDRYMFKLAQLLPTGLRGAYRIQPKGF